MQAMALIQWLCAGGQSAAGYMAQGGYGGAAGQGGAGASTGAGTGNSYGGQSGYGAGNQSAYGASGYGQVSLSPSCMCPSLHAIRHAECPWSRLRAVGRRHVGVLDVPEVAGIRKAGLATVLCAGGW